MTSDLAAAAESLRAARGVVVLTGAGVSAESGIRTFRASTSSAGSMGTLWKSFDPTTLATPQAFAADPARVTAWYDERRLGCLAAEPNPGHRAIATIERRVVAAGGRFRLLTQNVDRLHQRAGSREVVELHGSIMVWRCARSGERVEPPPTPFPHYPPRAAGGTLLRPDVVWFGEMLPDAALRAADEAIAWCDLFLSVGTSSVVYPAAGYLEAAHASGARTIEVNPEATPLTPLVDWSLRGPAGALLPQLVEAAFGRCPA